MLAEIPTQAQWLETLQSLMHYCVPQVERSTAGFGACAVLLVGGLVVAFRTGRVARGLVSLVGALVGAATGYTAGLRLGGPPELCAAGGAALVGLIAWRTHKLWLAAGSVVALSALLTSYQLLATGEFSKLVSELEHGGSKPVVKLVSPSEQIRNLRPDQIARLEKLWESVAATMRSWGVTGWLIPAVGLVVGVVLAIWALQMFAVVWLALLGAIAAVVGGGGIAMMVSPEAQAACIRDPRIGLGAIAAIWLLGLVWQAKQTRFGPKPAEKARPATA